MKEGLLDSVLRISSFIRELYKESATTSLARWRHSNPSLNYRELRLLIFSILTLILFEMIAVDQKRCQFLFARTGRNNSFLIP